MPRVQVLASDDDFAPAIQAAGSRLVVVDMFATWCGPCRTIAPHYERFSDQYADVVFLKADAEQCTQLASAFNVRGFPTFLFLYGGRMVETVVGGDPAALEAAIVRNAAGEGAPGAAADAGPPCVVQGMRYLNEFIAKGDSECLNQSDDNPLANAIADDDSLLISDCDEQLIVTLSFNQPVKVHSLLLTGPSDGRAPKNLKLFANHAATVDFDDAEKLPAVQELALTADNVAGDGTPVALRFVKFQKVTSLTIFVVDNQGDEELTAIKNIQVIGDTREATNMKEFKRVAGKVGERD